MIGGINVIYIDKITFFIIQSDEFKQEFSQNKSFSLSLKDSYSNVLSKYLNDEEIELTIEFKNVWFSYLPSQWVLKDVSFNARKASSYL